MVNITSGRNIQAVLLKLYKQCWNSMMKVITQIYLISLKYHSNECCVSYLAISMIMATLASCDQVIFEVRLYVLFQYVCVCFVKRETEFREIIHSWQINEITCLNERIFFSYTLFICHIFCFSINSIKALIVRIIIMEMAIQQVVTFAAILMNHSAIL